MGKEKRAVFLTILMPVFFMLAAVLIVWGVLGNGEYPSGSDTMYHLYRGDFVYRALGSGEFFPFYDSMWYNGIELLRYGAPLPAYILAGTQALAGGDVLNGYLIFVGLVFFCGAVEWLYIGKHEGRPWLGAFIGVLWFFMPYNLFVLFQEGNLARIICGLFFPVFFYGMICYRRNRSWGWLLAEMLLMVCMLLSHTGFAGLLALAAVLYLIVDVILCRKLRQALELIGSFVLGAMMAGIWLLPFFHGGVTEWDYSENLAAYFQDLAVTLDPMERFASGNAHAYFGLALLILALLGSIFAKRKEYAGFWTGIILLLGTSSTAYVVFNVVAGGSYMWMIWLVPAAAVMILSGFLGWKAMRRPLILLLSVLLALDCVPSLSLLVGNRSGEMAEDRLDEQQVGTLIAEAQEITTQRLALLDGGDLESMGAFLASGYGGPVAATMGYGWRAAATATNIVQLNRAREGGNYLYLFDRCMELGNDSVIVKTLGLDLEMNPLEGMDAAAQRVGYSLVDHNESYRLYHVDAEGSWGTVTEYEAIGIGTAAGTIALNYPVMEETVSTNLNDYTYEQLSKYKVIYLAGFTYDNRDYAEQMIQQLSENGVRIVIAADGIPENRTTHDQSFLGVVCNPIRFTNGYPELDTIDGIINPDLFPQGYSEWSTFYTEGLDECWGSVYDNNVRLEFYGTVKNDNIVVIGLNLTYHYSLTKDAAVGRLLDHAMDLSPDALPSRRIVPMTVEYGENTITVSTSEKSVNTALAYQDTFKSAQNLYNKNHLAMVDSGTAKITLSYPYLIPGLAVTAAGILLGIVYCLVMRGWIKKGVLDKKGQ